MTDPQANNNHYLMQALNFTERDLMLNRAGQLGPEQVAALGTMLHGSKRVLLQIVLFVVVIGAAGVILLLTQQDIVSSLQETLKDENGWVVLAIPGAVLGVWALMVLVALLRRPRVRPDMPVYSVEGTAAVRQMFLPPGSTANIIAQQVDGDVASFKLSIDRTVFFVVPLIAQGFVAGQMYRAYYIQFGRGKHGRYLVAAERL